MQCFSFAFSGTQFQSDAGEWVKAADAESEISEAGEQVRRHLRHITEQKKATAYDHLEQQRDRGGPTAEYQQARLTGRVQAFSEMLEALSALSVRPADLPISSRLGVGAKAWAELEDIEQRGISSRNNDLSGMMITWRTFTTVMNALRFCGESHWAALSVREPPTPSIFEARAYLPEPPQPVKEK